MVERLLNSADDNDVSLDNDGSLDNGRLDINVSYGNSIVKQQQQL